MWTYLADTPTHNVVFAVSRMNKRTLPSAPKLSVNIHDRFVRSVFAHVELVAAFLRLYATPILLKQLDLVSVLK